MSDMSSENTLRGAYNQVDGTISTNGFLVGKVNHKITAALSTTTVSNDTVTFTFFDGSTQLYAYKIIYPTTQTLPFTSAERIS